MVFNNGLRKRYRMGVLIALGVLAINQGYIQYSLLQKNEDARHINIAGRQRMLSQKINLLFYQADVGEVGREEISKAYEEWLQSHEELMYGNEESGLGPVGPEEVLLSMDSLQKRIHFIARQLSHLEMGIPVEPAVIAENQSAFLVQMNRLVEMLQVDADRKLRRIQMVEFALFLISVVIILLEVLFVFSPSVHFINALRNRFSEENAKLKVLMETLDNGALMVTSNFELANFNDSARHILQALDSNQTVALGVDLRQYLTPSLQNTMMRGFSAAMAGETTKSEVQLTLNDKDEWYLISCYPIRESQQRPVGVGISLVNIHSHKMSLQLCRRQNTWFRDRALRVSMEIRRPLASLRMVLHVFQSLKSPDECLQVVEELRSPCKKLVEISEDLQKDYDVLIEEGGPSNSLMSMKEA